MQTRIKTVKAAGGIILNKQGEIALVKNRNYKFWGFPKGKIEKGEASLETAMREIFEETGIKDLQLIAKLPTYKRTAFDNACMISNAMYLFKTVDTTLNPVKADSEKAEWVSFSLAASRLDHPQDRAYLMSIKEILNNFCNIHSQ